MALMRVSSALVGCTVAVVATVATGSVALSSGRGIRTRGEIRPYAVAHAGVVPGLHVRGDARTRTRNGHTEVRASARGLAPGALYAARLVNGRCTDYDAAFKFDPSGPATRDNGVWLDLRAQRRGEASDRIRVRPLPSGHVWSMVIFEGGNTDPGARIACGDLKPD
jgi:hypothetical protein